jgi:hypothetical protein
MSERQDRSTGMPPGNMFFVDDAHALAAAPILGEKS